VIARLPQSLNLIVQATTKTYESNLTEETMRNKMIYLLNLALAGMFVSGCNSFPSAWSTRPITNPSSLTGKTTIVVPVKGAPISLQNSQTGTALLLGVVGVGIKEGFVDKPKRDALVAGMAGSSVFSPEVILAEECVDLLKRSSWASATNVMLFNGLEIMHGSGPEIEGETRVFKSTMTHHEVNAWHEAYSNWITGGPVHTFSTSDAGSGRLVSLEVTVESVLIKKDFYIGSWMRLMDPVSGKPLASGFAHDKFRVRPIKSTADIDAFVEDYRKCARQLSEILLKQLKLMP